MVDIQLQLLDIKIPYNLFLFYFFFYLKKILLTESQFLDCFLCLLLMILFCFIFLPDTYCCWKKQMTKRNDIQMLGNILPEYYIFMKILILFKQGFLCLARVFSFPRVRTKLPLGRKKVKILQLFSSTGKLPAQFWFNKRIISFQSVFDNNPFRA